MITRIILIVAFAFAGGGCGGGSQAAEPGGGDASLEVVASFYPLAYAIERVGGTRVRVTNLTPPGAEPHDIELSVRDVERVRAADLVVYLGSGFQPQLERAVGDGEGRALDLLAGLDLLPGGDPHVWLDPLRYTEIVDRLGRELGAETAARALTTRLRGLDGELEQGLAECERREIVTSHAAFGYLAERYGLVQIAITGIAPEAEPTARDLERVVELVRDRGATTIFFETLVSPRLAETVARETGANTAVLNPIEGLTEEEVERGEDYFSVMRANLAALRKGLGCR